MYADMLNTQGFTFGSNPDSRWHNGAGVFTQGEIDFKGCYVKRRSDEYIWVGTIEP